MVGTVETSELITLGGVGLSIEGAKVPTGFASTISLLLADAPPDCGAAWRVEETGPGRARKDRLAWGWFLAKILLTGDFGIVACT